MKVHVLGGGQDVGRSCIVVNLGCRRVMFDCGAHPGYHDTRRFPDFTSLGDPSTIDLVLITHFHIDHCGALPHLTEVYGYSGPIYMTLPTRDLALLMLEDLLKNSRERKQNAGFVKSDIAACLTRVTAIPDIDEVVRPKGMEDIEVRVYHAGHVVGAVMFYVRAGEESVLYTGDYSSATERHLPPVAFPDVLKPDLLITEATYCTTTRTGGRRNAELSLMKSVYDSLSAGGKVLIPVSAFGRAQELIAIIRAHVIRMELDVPLYIASGLVSKANLIYNKHSSWCSEEFATQGIAAGEADSDYARYIDGVVSASTLGRMNEFWRKRDWHLIEEDGPMLLFATPGMLTAGLSLDVFKEWAGDPKNVVVVPGFCFSTALGEPPRAGSSTPRVPNTRCKLVNLAFSPHTDSRGIRRMIRKTSPRAVMLVHGNKENISSFKESITDDFGLPVYDPANGSITEIGLTTREASMLKGACLNRKNSRLLGLLANSKWKTVIASFREGDGHASKIASKPGRFQIPCEKGDAILKDLHDAFPGSRLGDQQTLASGGIKCAYDRDMKCIRVVWKTQTDGKNADVFIKTLENCVTRM